MEARGGEHQLGDFIKGRQLFIEDYCKKRGLDFERTMESIRAEALRIAGTEERREILQKRLFSGSVLSSSYLPDWLDRVFLEAMSKVLRGPGANLTTTSSRMSCIPFEAGRFNAQRQADTVFRLLYENKRPEDWLKTTFPVLYRKCYGDEVMKMFQVEELAPHKFRLTVDNRTQEKASAMDCSTTIGYLFGSLEKLRAQDILVTHTHCGAGRGASAPLCQFELAWR